MSAQGDFDDVRVYEENAQQRQVRSAAPRIREVYDLKVHHVREMNEIIASGAQTVAPLLSGEDCAVWVECPYGHGEAARVGLAKLKMEGLYRNGCCRDG